MDLTSDQFKLATKFVQDWFKDKKLELETTFGAGGVIDSTTFLQIAQRLRNKGFDTYILILFIRSHFSRYY